jgi:hypothetical protein
MWEIASPPSADRNDTTLFGHAKWLGSFGGRGKQRGQAKKSLPDKPTYNLPKTVDSLITNPYDYLQF